MKREPYTKGAKHLGKVAAKLCPKSKKRRYNSRSAALRAGTQRYGSTGNAYACGACGAWHLTRRDVPQDDHDEQLDHLVDVALGKADA